MVESKMAFCKLDLKVCKFIKTDMGDWVCTSCHFICGHVDGEDVTGGDKYE